jgi:hypothetical protein
MPLASVTVRGGAGGDGGEAIRARVRERET